VHDPVNKAQTRGKTIGSNSSLFFVNGCPPSLTSTRRLNRDTLGVVRGPVGIFEATGTSESREMRVSSSSGVAWPSRILYYYSF
jgi:hypothetical protein